MTAEHEGLVDLLAEHPFIDHIVCGCGRDGQTDRRWTSHRAHLADALAARDRRVRAEALREAARDLPTWEAGNEVRAYAWLRARADRIEAP